MPKTLDDIKGKFISRDKNGFADMVVKVSSLKDEAVEWIKEWRDINKNSMISGGPPMIHGKIKAFEMFFNISDEDLE